jgi:hypothetical protein
MKGVYEMTLHKEEPEQAKKLMNEVCSKMVDEYYFEFEPSGDLVIILDGRYFPVSNRTDVLSYNITSGSNRGHTYILLHLTNDRTQEKRQIALVVCQFRVWTDNQYLWIHQMPFILAYVMMSNTKTNGNVQPPRAMILSKWVAYSVNDTDKTLIAETAKPVDQTKQRPMAGQFIIDRPYLEPFIAALTIMIESSLSLPVTNVLIHDLKIDACMHCAKYIPKLRNIKTIGSKDIEILKRLDKELPLHVCSIGMGYYSKRLTPSFSKRHLLFSRRLKTAAPKDLVKYHKEYCRPVDPKQVEICKQFLLEFCEKTDRINKDGTSYGLKHAVEQWTSVKKYHSWWNYDYVTNGAFIRAALDLGYRCEYAYGIGPNVYLNISIKKWF